jgi:uncharacterized membrane protein YeaQ/YmgE (transglycosylase-associated protein family)
VGIIWMIIIGFIAGVIPKLTTPGKNGPAGFILTAILGIVGRALPWVGTNPAKAPV